MQSEHEEEADKAKKKDKDAKKKAKEDAEKRKKDKEEEDKKKKAKEEEDKKKKAKEEEEQKKLRQRLDAENAKKEKELAAKQKAKEREEHNKRVIEGNLKISAASSIKEAEERRLKRVEEGSDEQTEIRRREALATAEIIIENRQTLSGEEVEVAIGDETATSDPLDDPLNTGRLEDVTATTTSSSDQDRLKTVRHKFVLFLSQV